MRDRVKILWKARALSVQTITKRVIWRATVVYFPVETCIPLRLVRRPDALAGRTGTFLTFLVQGREADRVSHLVRLSFFSVSANTLSAAPAFPGLREAPVGQHLRPPIQAPHLRIYLGALLMQNVSAMMQDSCPSHLAQHVCMSILASLMPSDSESQGPAGSKRQLCRHASSVVFASKP